MTKRLSSGGIEEGRRLSAFLGIVRPGLLPPRRSEWTLADYATNEAQRSAALALMAKQSDEERAAGYIGKHSALTGEQVRNMAAVSGLTVVEIRTQCSAHDARIGGGLMTCELQIALGKPVTKDKGGKKTAGSYLLYIVWRRDRREGASNSPTSQSPLH